MEGDQLIKFPKNVNEYAHLIKASIHNHHELEWYLDLRHPYQAGKMSKKEEQPPSFLKREARKPRSTLHTACHGRHQFSCSQVVEIPAIRRKAGLFSHLCHHRIGTAPNPSQLNFETTLREEPKSRDGSLPPMKKTSRSKSPISGKERTEAPYNGLEVSINSSKLTHLFIPGATQQTLLWSLNLRSSGPKRSKSQLTKHRPKNSALV